MKSKKEKILESAVELFAQNGFHATSTSSIAKKAGVSQGLMFSHFGSKQGLVEALLEEAVQKAGEMWKAVFEAQTGKETLQKCIEIVFTYNGNTQESNYWLLISKLKWEIGYSQEEKTKVFLEKLTWAFAELNYENPEMETQMLWVFLQNIFIEILKGNRKKWLPYQDFLIQKYKL